MGYLSKQASQQKGLTAPKASALEFVGKLKKSLRAAKDKVTDLLMKDKEKSRRILTTGGGLTLAVGAKEMSTREFLDKLPEIAAEAETPGNAKALAALAEQAAKDKVGLIFGEGVGGPAYDGLNNAIVYDPTSMPLHSGVLAHELGHAKVHNKLKELLGDSVGENVSNYGSGLLGNTAPQLGLLAAAIPAYHGKTKTALIAGGLGSLLTVPRLLDEGIASHWGKTWLDERGLEGGDKAWSGFGTYAAGAAVPLAPGLSAAGAKRLIKFLKK